MRPRRLVPALVAAVVIAGCTDDKTTLPTTTTLSPTTTTEPAHVDDGQLSIGVLLPRTGDGAVIGQPMADAVTRAVREINGAGGVNGRAIELVEADEGSTVASAGDAVATLIEADVDVVIGPASSTIALATLQELTDAGMLTCSPSASALALDAFPDDGRFFRTIPSDSLQARAIAQLAEQTGATSAAVAFLDDAYGRPLATVTVEDLAGRGLEIVAQVPYTGGEGDLAAAAEDLIAAEPGVVIVIGDADGGTRMLSALGEQTRRQEVVTPPDIIINGALRRPPSAQAIAGLPGPLVANLQGVAPMARRQVDAEPPGPFATNAYDCVNLIALGAVQTETDNPADIAASLPDVSVQGSLCRDFDTCASLIGNSLNIDYDGPSGVLQLSTEGDPSRARFEVFGFGPDGIEGSRRTFNYP